MGGCFRWLARLTTAAKGRANGSFKLTFADIPGVELDEVAGVAVSEGSDGTGDTAVSTGRAVDAAGDFTDACLDAAAMSAKALAGAASGAGASFVCARTTNLSILFYARPRLNDPCGKADQEDAPNNL